MAADDRVGPYSLVAPFRTTGGGHCQWTFARRGAKDFFIKRFLSPTFPTPDGPGGPQTKARKRIRCAAFEQHHQLVQQRLGPLSGVGGNLVVSRDFFREGAHYYKVTDKVDVSSATPPDIAALPDDNNLTLLLSLVHSVAILHTHGLVHGDLKPANVLVQRDQHGGLTTKVIDFDNCYPTGRPAAAAETVTDLGYAAPETLEHLASGTDGSALTTKADVFALGLVFAEYLTGTGVAVDGACYPGEALRTSGRLVLPSRPGREPVLELVSRMLCRDPDRRPGCREIRDILQRIRRRARTAPPALVPGAPTDVAPPALRGTLIQRLQGRAEPPAATEASRLRGSLARRAADRPR